MDAPCVLISRHLAVVIQNALGVFWNLEGLELRLWNVFDQVIQEGFALKAQFLAS